MKPETRLSLTMARQHSLATRAQALEAGLTRSQIGFRLKSGLWVAVHRGVYRPSSVRPYFKQLVMAACLAVDGFASHRCAAVVYGLRGFEDELLELTFRGHRRRRLVDVELHRDERLDRRDLTTRWHLPLTTPGRTLLDIASCHPHLAERAVNDVLYRRLARPEAIRSTIARARDQPGARLLAEIIDHLATPTESVLEDDFLALVRRHHSAPDDRRRDRLKRRVAEAEGWDWHDVYWEDVHEWGSDTAVRLDRLLRQGRAAA